ncbi:MAG: hypothetical protein QF890_13620 [Myxococcota bacterium]|jgi:hypothetical protein|nr:hypothetical protein [Deltaproteobacteria bacterium]MDP6075775.1 hypothetical protein [Myxococcota bacterium]MBT40621.1 hypothetical protein [Deltaproteobacteria bacterium]MDP6242630.1 hypothetical protein [Myxococcota bacterium]MDP7075520.1 hypothetical protein [Myxococcota bacterium]
MIAEFLPRRADTAPGFPPARELLAIFSGALGLAALFWAPLLLGGALHGHDWSTHHFHYFDWVRQSFAEYGAVPLYMADAWVTPNFLANAEAPTFGPLAWLLLVLPTGVYVKFLFVVFTALGLAGGWLLARDLGGAPPVAAFASGVFAFGGFFASHLAVGHHWAMGAWLLPGLVWLVRRAALGSDAALVVAAALNAFTILGGQHQPFVWQNLLLGALALLWALRVRAWFPLWRVGLLVLLSAGLGAAKLAPLWIEFANYAPEARIQGLPAGSLVASLLARGQTPERLDPSIVLEWGAGWWEYAFYLGPLAFALVALGLVATRGAWELALVGAFFAVLAVESSPLWRLIEDFPVWRSQRCPARFLVLGLFGLVFAAVPGLERLRRLAARYGPRQAAVLAWGVAVLVCVDLWIESRPWQATATGPAIARRDHRPQPEEVHVPGAAARLTAFAPNRLVYAVDAAAPARFVLPVHSGADAWSVDGASASTEVGWLVIEVPSGTREVALRYGPPGLGFGAAVSGASALFCAGFLFYRRRA